MNRRPLGLAIAGVGFVVGVGGLVGSALDDEAGDGPTAVADSSTASTASTAIPLTSQPSPTTAQTTTPFTGTATVAPSVATTTRSTTAPADASLPAAPTSTAAAATTPAPATTAPATTATTRMVETAEEFVAAFGAALRAGDGEFLLRRLHPAVEARYGRLSCQTYLAGVSDPEFAGEIDSVTPAPDWVWETDGRSTPIPDAITVLLIRRNGQPATEAHFAAVDSELRWFTDCGDAIN